MRQLGSSGFALLLLLAACRPGDGIGESRVDFDNKYFWVEHDGESQIAQYGTIIVDDVKEAHADGPIIIGTKNDGSTFRLDTRTGSLRTGGEAK